MEILCEYEKIRLSNMKENSELLKSLGLEVIKRPKIHSAGNASTSIKRKGKQRRRRYSSSSSESGDEWLPGMDEDARVVPRERLPLTDMLDVDFYSTSLPTAPQYCAELDDVMLPDWLLDSSSEEEDFYGYMIDNGENDSDVEEVSTVIHSKLDDKWFDEFGDYNEAGDNNFEGFELEELDEPPRLKLSRYPRRSNSGVVYVDEELSDEDHYLFCEDCQELHHGDCPTHGSLKQLDPSAGFDEFSKESTSLPVPSGFTVRTSSIPNAGLGVFATKCIPKGVQFGPYEGECIVKSDLIDSCDTSYMWEIRPSNAESYLVDGKSDGAANWLKFVNCARTEEEQNLVAFQYYGNIYYRTFKSIPVGSELFVWYGEQYARDLGISVHHSSDFLHMCKYCGAAFAEKSSFTAHLRRSKICFDANPLHFVCLKCKERFAELHQLQHHIRRHESNRCDTQQASNITSQGKRRRQRNGESTGITTNYELKKRSSVLVLKDSTNCDESKMYSTVTSSSRVAVKDIKQEHSLHLHIYTQKRFGKKFTQPDTSVRTPIGEKPYKCEYCDYSCAYKHHLVTHIRTHKGEKPYKCEYCDYSSAYKTNLVTHIRTHTGEKPYKCEYCDYSCAYKANLVTHIRTH